MIIKAKYPCLRRPYMHCECQGIGSTYGGNRQSIINRGNFLLQEDNSKILQEDNNSIIL